MKGEKHIYFLRPVGQPGPIKIGCSINPAGRLATVLIWSPIKLEIAAMIVGGHDFERMLHDRFARQRLHGEWFEACPALTELVSNIAKGGGLPQLEPRRHRTNRDPSAAEIEAITAAYEKGTRVKEIGLTLGWSMTKVNRVLDIAMPNRARHKRGRPAGFVDLAAAARAGSIYRRRLQGFTIQKIANEEGVSRQRVHQILAKFARPTA